jgi:hypothetical protein
VILMLRNFQFDALSRGSQCPDLPYKKALRDIFGGIQSTSVVTGNSVTLLLESSLLNIDISLTTLSHFTSIYPEPAVTTHHQLINQEAIYMASCVAVNLIFNSEAFQRTQDFPLGQRVPHSTFPAHHRLWDTTPGLPQYGGGAPLFQF